MSTMTVESAAPDTIGDTPVWRVITRHLSGDGITHIFPTSTLEWRAAEYGIDPADTDTLLEIILHELHLPTTIDDRGVTRYTSAGPDLWTAESTMAAREAHLTRVRECPTQINVRTATALDVIRVSHVPNLARIRAMREAVDTQRWINRYGDLPVKPTLSTVPEAPRA